MAKIKGEVDVNAQDEKVLNEEFLPDINDERVEAGEEPFASMDDYATFILEQAFADYVSDKKSERAVEVGDKFNEADPAVQDQIKDLLGL